jgi:hypothetical protein
MTTMTYPNISDKVLYELDRLGFQGLDVNPRTSIFEYGGMYSRQLQSAMLCDPNSKDPGVSFQRITTGEVIRAARDAGSGFLSFTGRKEIDSGDEPMELIQALMMWNGGFHINCFQWTRLSAWRESDMLRSIHDLQP